MNDDLSCLLEPENGTDDSGIGTATQIERYRATTEEERLRIAMDLHELVCDVARAGIWRQFSEADGDEVNAIYADVSS